MTHVPYRATPQAVGDVAAGHVGLSFAEAGASLALICDGKLRALAVSPPIVCRFCPTFRRFPTPRAGGFRNRLMARSARAGQDPATIRRKPACRDETHHVRSGDADKARRSRPDPDRYTAVDGVRAYIKPNRRSGARWSRGSVSRARNSIAMPGRLQDKVALVTGAGCVGPGWGNGRATAVLFAREGAKVFAVDRHAEAMTETLARVAEFGGTIKPHDCDVTDGTSVKAMVEACLAAFGRIDVLVNNVGGSAAGGPVELSEEAWDGQMDYNLKSVFLACKHVLPVMERQGGGAIINLASTSGLRWTGSPQVGYAASKAGVIQLSRVVAVQYANKGIRVNTVVPGPVAHADGRGAAGQAARRRRRRGAAASRGSSASRWASWATAATPPTPRCSSPPTRRASSPAPRSSSMAAWWRAAIDPA